MMMARHSMSLLLLLFLISLPFELHGVRVTEERLQNLKTREVILPSGKTATLGELYKTGVTVENFNPGERFLQLLLNPNARPHLQYSRIPDLEHLQDLDVKFDYIQSTHESLKRNKMILLKGDPQTGKTRALRILESIALDEAVPKIPIYVDLPHLVASDPRNRHTLTADDILRSSVHEDFVDLITNIAEVNPSAVEILLDGVDQVPHAQQQKIFSAISEFHGKRMSIVMSSSTDIKPALIRNHQITPTTIEIPSTLSINNFETYATHYWMERLLNLDALGHAGRFTEYTKSFRLLIEETPLPRSVGVVQKLLERAIQPSALSPFPSLEEYINHPEIHANPKSIIKLSDGMALSKLSIYNDVFEYLQPQIEVYGPQALNMMFKSSTPSEIQAAVASSRQAITEHGPNAYKYLIFENGLPVDFVHPEYMRYFAAKYILNSFTTNSPLVDCFKATINDPKQIFVTEFIDRGANTEQLQKIRAIFAEEIRNMPRENIYQITDNFLKYRIDNLCSEMFKALGKRSLKTYLTDLSVILHSENKYSFGMLSEVRNVDRRFYMPRKTPWLNYKGTRPEMFIHLDMTKSLATAKLLKFKIPNHTKVQIASKVGFRYFQNMVERAQPGTIPEEVLNKAMYESITALGPDSIRILRSLRRLGANPANVKVDGRTLAHAAAKFRNLELLKAVHEDLGVSLVDSKDIHGQTILYDLLESELPFNTYLRENSWETIDYLVEKGDLSVNIDDISHESSKFLEFSPKIHDIPEPYLKLLIYNHGTETERTAVETILKNYIPLENVDISPEILSLRRKLIIKNCLKIMNEQGNTRLTMMRRPTTVDHVTLSELLISHHSLMGRYDFQSYKNTIKHLLLKEGRTFTSSQLQRTLTALVKNSIYDVELIELKDMIRADVQPSMYDPILLDLDNAIIKRIRHDLPSKARGITLDSYVLETAYDLYPQLTYVNPDNENLLMRSEIKRNDDMGHDSPFSDDALACDF